MSDEETKYTRIEYERRFLVPPSANWRDYVEPYSKLLEDKYIRGTRLRLRVLTDSDSGRRIVKLNKKFESDSPYFQTIARIILSQAERDLLGGLDGDCITKRRYYHSYLDRVYSIDVFAGELEGLVLCETEAESLDELMSTQPPPYVGQDLTEDVFFTGGSLCRTSRFELARRLSE